MTRQREAESTASTEWGGSEEMMGDPEEQRVLFAALDSFYQYAKVAHYNATHTRRQAFYAMPQAHWQLLSSAPFSYLDTLNAVDDAIDENAELASAIVRKTLDSFGADLTGWQGTATSSDLEKARSTIRQFYRDWSAEGSAERDACFLPIIEDLLTERLVQQRSKLNVLVPGAGLGRLVFELCRKGFSTEGNEISYHQLLASSYVLNSTPCANAHTIYPWIHSFSNHRTRSNHLQSVTVPDVHPGATLATKQSNSDSEPGQMSMSASDFLLLYNQEDYRNTFDAVATCFFIDTAPNPIRYIETVRNCLKPGGIWTNLGPLLWHFEYSAPGKNGDTEGVLKNGVDTSGIADPGSVELTDDEVLALVEMLGFKIEKRENGVQAGYIQDPSSMLQSTYNSSHWVARKL